MSLSVHISKHKAVEEKRFPCPKCNKFYHSNHYLKRHIETHTTDKTKKTVPCPHCPKQYTTEQSLRFHIKYAHSNPDHKKSCCEICGKQFVSQNVVKSHVRNVHCSQSDLNDRQVNFSSSFFSMKFLTKNFRFSNLYKIFSMRLLSGSIETISVHDV